MIRSPDKNIVYSVGYLKQLLQKKPSLLDFRKEGIPDGFWKNIENQRIFFDWVGKKLNITKWQDWYNVSLLDIQKNGGHTLIGHHYAKSHIKALMTIYSEHPWRVWQFKRTTKSFWKDRKNQRNFLDWVAHEKKFTKWEDWYQVSCADIANLGGRSLLNLYNGSHIQAITTNYPEHLWLPWKFQVVPHNFWENKENVLAFLEHASSELKVSNLEDWYMVSKIQMSKLGGSRVLARYGGLIGLLKACYPNYPWDTSLFDSRGFRSQAAIRHYINEIFPNHEIIWRKKSLE